MKTRELTCIVCPRGCSLSVELDGEGGVLSVSGNLCPRGKEYAINECTHPVRVVTSTVRCECGSVIPVKTAGAVPKELVFKVMKEINSALVKDGVEIGDVIIENVCGTGVDVVATAPSR